MFQFEKYLASEEYAGIWAFLIDNFLTGFMARGIAVMSLVAAFWFLVYRRNTFAGVVLMIITIIVAYFGSALKYLLTL